jgi:predicted phosphodiesterase
MTKIALFSDIHGNSVALDAVLADIAAQGGVDGYWILGDLAAIGHDPVGVLERLANLPNARFVRGNADRYIVTGDRPPPSLADAESDPKRLPALVEVAGSMAWTQGALTVSGWIEWLGQLPLDMEETLPDGTRFLGVHGSPGLDGGMGIAPHMHDEEIIGRLQGCSAQLICVGHTHYPLNRRVGEWHVVNPGSLSNPQLNDPDKRASYVLLSADKAGYQVEHRRVEYDRAAVIAALERQRHPGAAFIIRHLRADGRL